MIQLRYPVPGTDRTAYVLLDAVPSVCEPAPAHERSFEVDLKQELEGYSASGIRVHRAEARYVLEYNEATQSVVLSLEGDRDAQGCIRGESWQCPSTRSC